MVDLIFDRKSEDIARLKILRTKIKNRTATEEEYQEWLTSMKGAYNITDLNRVGEAVNYLADLLNRYGYKNKITAKTNWKIGEKPNPQQMEKYINDLEKLAKIYVAKPNTPELPKSADNLTFTQANNIEKLLNDIKEIITGMTYYFIHSGISSFGQDMLWQKRFRMQKIWATQDYNFSQYLDDDTVMLIASQDKELETKRTAKLNLVQIDEYQKISNSIATYNDSLQILDSLIGKGG